MTKTLQDYKDVLRVGDEVEIDGEWKTLVEKHSTMPFYLLLNEGIEELGWDTEITGYRPKKRTLETLEVGDYVKDEAGDIRRILMAQGKGEYRTYITSWLHKEEYGDILEDCRHLMKRSAREFTAYEFKVYGYIHYTPQEETTLTMDEVAKKFGVAEDRLRIKKNDD